MAHVDKQRSVDPRNLPGYRPVAIELLTLPKTIITALAEASMDLLASGSNSRGRNASRPR